MDPHSFIARAEAQRWIGIAEKLLMGHDLVGSKTFAIRARESDPRLEAADQILAIADTLLAAEKRVAGSHGTQQPDYYAILQLVRFVQDTEHIADQYRRLAVTLNPQQNRFPYSDQAFQLVNDAWAVLSNPLRKSMYDGELDFPQQQEMNHIGFNLEHHHHHQHQQQQQQHQHHQQQHQHNFFSINRMGSGNEQELVEQQQTFLQTRVQRSHQQHNFLSQSNPFRPSPVREQEQLFEQREQEEQLFRPQVQPFQITSTPQQQSRPPPQPPQPQLPMRSSTPPPPPAVSQQPPVSWPQPQPHSEPQPPIPSTTPPPPPPAALPQPPVSWPQPSPHSQPQQRTRSRTPPPPPPAAPTQPPVYWPQAPPHSQPPLHPQPQSPQQHQHFHPPPLPQPQLQQPQPQQEQHHQQQESPEQNATPVQPPPQVDTNNSVSEEENVRVTESDSENVDPSPTFWTACPFCLYMYEYPRVYAECTLRCSNCERAFQAVQVPSPPPIVEGQEAYFCCWGSFPLGISISNLDNNNGKGTNKNWTSISPLYDVSPQVHHNLNDDTTPKKSRNWGPRIYIDDVTDDIFTGISEPSDDSDLDWNGTKNKKVKKTKKRGRKRKAKAVAVNKTRKRRNKNQQNSVEIESSEKALVSNSKSNSNPRRQSGRVAKEMGKLDLNVEFNNNEGEESSSKMIGGNRGHGHGEEDNNGFFEGLDEFLNSLPILSVVNEEKGKAS